MVSERVTFGIVHFDISIGAWRSLVAHLHGVQGVAGSSPVAPTFFSGSQNEAGTRCQPFFCVGSNGTL